MEQGLVSNAQRGLYFQNNKTNKWNLTSILEICKL